LRQSKQSSKQSAKNIHSLHSVESKKVVEVETSAPKDEDSIFVEDDDDRTKKMGASETVVNPFSHQPTQSSLAMSKAAKLRK